MCAALHHVISFTDRGGIGWRLQCATESYGVRYLILVGTGSTQASHGRYHLAKTVTAWYTVVQARYKAAEACTQQEVGGESEERERLHWDLGERQVWGGREGWCKAAQVLPPPPLHLRSLQARASP